MSVPVVNVPGLEEAIQKRNQLESPPNEQPAWERNLKRGLAVVVAAATAVVPFLSPASDGLALKVCGVVIGFGAALGITSRGNLPK